MDFTDAGGTATVAYTAGNNIYVRIADNDADYVTPLDMLAELRQDNLQITASMRETHGLCDEHGDVATASLLENWIKRQK